MVSFGLVWFGKEGKSTVARVLMRVLEIFVLYYGVCTVCGDGAGRRFTPRDVYLEEELEGLGRVGVVAGGACRLGLPQGTGCAFSSRDLPRNMTFGIECQILIRVLFSDVAVPCNGFLKSWCFK